MQELVIDWELATKLAGNSREFAEDMLQRLAKELTNQMAEIKKEYDIYDFNALKIHLHSLHGALCYCGAPRLKRATAAFEQAINEKQYLQIAASFRQFESEVKELIKHVTHSADSASWSAK